MILQYTRQQQFTMKSDKGEVARLKKEKKQAEHLQKLADKEQDKAEKAKTKRREETTTKNWQSQQKEQAAKEKQAAKQQANKVDEPQITQQDHMLVSKADSKSTRLPPFGFKHFN
eukprot:Skav215372  [mRNA]  locus=scaffold1391:840366:840710:+ [translate_table: standard]